MKAYLATVLVIDDENYGAEDFKIALDNMRYWYPKLISVKEADIGEWSDEHPLNNYDTMKSECARLFGDEHE